MIYEYLLCMINGATGGTTLQLKRKYSKRGYRQYKGFVLGMKVLSDNGSHLGKTIHHFDFPECVRSPVICGNSS